MNTEILFTVEEMKKISHSLGIQLFESVMSHQLKDKILPKEFYRNFFQVPNCEVFEKLVIDGYASKREVFEQKVYHITPKGQEKFRQEFDLLVNYQPTPKRGLIYLKHRIEFYCNFYNYKFGNDNAGHVISAYQNYYLSGFRMSHTTTDCVDRFLKELKAQFKTVSYGAPITQP
ncbi:hypothetical protein ACM55F_10125 [Flavobacterium sp. XS2P12]|uniref:hypothetical protein n=1 Tax=Flavobacterium melibiosi TaxID=3398734 RepID=UPI003A858F5A